MTERWVSNKNHYCELCRCWMRDTPQARAIHERGSQHKQNVADHLRSVRENAKREERERRELAAELARIEAAAKAAFDRDLAKGDAREEERGAARGPSIGPSAGSSIGPSAGSSIGPSAAVSGPAGGKGRATAEAVAADSGSAAAAASSTSLSSPSDASLGTWELKEGTQGYYYNAVQRFYYDEPSGMYYGGDPPDWTETPSIPEAARFEAMKRERDESERRASGERVDAAAEGADEPAAAGARRPRGASAVPSAGGAGAAAPSAASAAASTSTVVASSRTGQGTPSLVPLAGARSAIAHPLSQVGGYSMPAVGQIGGAKGLGSSEQIRAQKKRYRELKDIAEGKRLPPGLDDPALPEEERAARVRREAARARVLLRTMDTFGLR